MTTLPDGICCRCVLDQKGVKAAAAPVAVEPAPAAPQVIVGRGTTAALCITRPDNVAAPSQDLNQIDALVKGGYPTFTRGGLRATSPPQRYSVQETPAAPSTITTVPHLDQVRESIAAKREVFVRNPQTGRHVRIDGAAGQKIIADTLLGIIQGNLTFIIR